MGKLFRCCSLTGKVAIITGAKGIGEAIAHTYAQAGANVVVSSRKQEAVEAVAEQINQAKAVGIAAHTGDLEAIQKLVEGTLEAFGGVDIVVNNAATNPHFGPLLTEILVNELAPDNIQVNAIAPGFIKTKFSMEKAPTFQNRPTSNPTKAHSAGRSSHRDCSLPSGSRFQLYHRSHFCRRWRYNDQ